MLILNQEALIQLYKHANVELYPSTTDVIYGTLNSIEIMVDNSITEYKYEWPEDRFVEYEKSDENWGIYFGICKQVPQPTVYEINTALENAKFNFDIKIDNNFDWNLYKDVYNL